jgi:hypothetical protein
MTNNENEGNRNTGYLKNLIKVGKKGAAEEDAGELIGYLTNLQLETDELRQEIFQLLQFLDNSLVQEDSLLNQRINLFLLVQTFLIAGYIQSLTLSLTFTAFVVAGIAFTGVFTSVLSMVSLQGSQEAIDYYVHYYEFLKQEVLPKKAINHYIHYYKFLKQEVLRKKLNKHLQYYFKYYPPIYFSGKDKGSCFVKRLSPISITSIWVPIYFIIIWIILLVGTFTFFSPIPKEDTVNTLFKGKHDGDYVIIDERYKGRTYGICFHKPCLLLPLPKK